MAIELVIGMSVCWERAGDLFYITEMGADGTKRTIAILGPSLLAFRPMVDAAVAARRAVRAGSGAVPIGKGKRAKH